MEVHHILMALLGARHRAVAMGSQKQACASFGHSANSYYSSKVSASVPAAQLIPHQLCFLGLLSSVVC